MKLSMGLLSAVMGTFGQPSVAHLNSFIPFQSYTGNHSKKINKTSQKAKRKRARQLNKK